MRPMPATPAIKRHMFMGRNRLSRVGSRVVPLGERSSRSHSQCPVVASRLHRRTYQSVRRLPTGEYVSKPVPRFADEIGVKYRSNGLA